MGRSPRTGPKRLGIKLKRIRKWLELSQVGMCKELGFKTVLPGHISEYERGKRLPPYLVLLKYARIAGCSTDLLIDDKLDIFPNG